VTQCLRIINLILFFIALYTKRVQAHYMFQCGMPQISSSDIEPSLRPLYIPRTPSTGERYATCWTRRCKQLHPTRCEGVILPFRELSINGQAPSQAYFNAQYSPEYKLILILPFLTKTQVYSYIKIHPQHVDVSLPHFND
jgi:hypothetical protein